MGGGSGDSSWFGSDDSSAGGGGGLLAWLSSRFAQQNDVDAKIAAVAARLTEQIDAIPTTNQQGQPDMMYMHDGVELTKEVRDWRFGRCSSCTVCCFDWLYVCLCTRVVVVVEWDKSKHQTCPAWDWLDACCHLTILTHTHTPHGRMTATTAANGYQPTGGILCIVKPRAPLL